VLQLDAEAEMEADVPLFMRFTEHTVEEAVKGGIKIKETSR